MTEISAPYVTTPTVAGQRISVVSEPEPPLSPRVRALIIVLRRVCYLLGDGLGEYAGLAKRE